MSILRREQRGNFPWDQRQQGARLNVQGVFCQLELRKPFCAGQQKFSSSVLRSVFLQNNEKPISPRWHEEFEGLYVIIWQNRIKQDRCGFLSGLDEGLPSWKKPEKIQHVFFLIPLKYYILTRVNHCIITILDCIALGKSEKNDF